MSFLNQSEPMASPLQNHPIVIMGETQIISGDLETLGMPHPYINQNNLEFFKVQNAVISPWSHLGLPTSKKDMAMIHRGNIQLFAFTDASTNDEYRVTLRNRTLLITLPIAILRGKAPFMSDASVANFLEFYKGTFVPIIDAEVHYFVSTGINLQRKMSLMYINRNFIHSYVDAE